MKLFRFVLPAAALLGLPALGLAPRLAAEEVDGAALYQKCVKSAVFICTPLTGGHAEGSGSLIDAEKRLVITNYHVVDEEKYIYVQFPIYNKDGSMMTDKKKYIERIPAGQALKGTVLYRDKTRDLALVQLDRLPAGTPAIPLAKKSVTVGTTVINIGNPGAVNQTFSTTRGEVRAVGMEDLKIGGAGDALRLKCKMVTLTNPINHGDSGGPIIDKRGYQVAVTESGMFGGAVQNVNLCVDVSEVRAFLNEKKIIIKELGDEKDEVVSTVPKVGPGSKGATPKGKDIPGSTVPPTPPATGIGATTPPPMTPAGTPPVAAPNATDEAAAAQLLQRAKLFREGEDNRPTYIAKLKDVATKFPGTSAAKEAKLTLDTLK